MTATTEGRSIPCTHCGGVFALPRLTAEVQCPFCGQRQQLPPELLQELSQYQASVQGNLALAGQDRDYLAAYNEWYAQPTFLWARLGVAAAAVLLLPVLTGVWGALLKSAGWLPAPMDYYHGAFIFAGFLGGVALALFWLWVSRGSEPKRQVGARTWTVACPQCGAPAVMHAGQSLETCAHCRAALAPSRAVVQQGMDAAKQAKRHAAMQRYRAERSTMAVARYVDFSWLPPIIIGVFTGVPLVAVVVVMTVRWVMGSRGFDVGIVFGWLVVLGVAGGLYGFLRWRSNRKARWRQALEDLAYQFGGRRLADLEQVIGWLDRYWAGPYDVNWLWAGSHHGAAAVEVAGYPALVDVNPTEHQQQHPRRLHLLLAAWIPGLSDGEGQRPALSGPVGALFRRIEQYGFLLEIQEAGFLARAKAPLVAQLHQNPDAAHTLAPVLAAMAELAQACDALPAPAMAA